MNPFMYYYYEQFQSTQFCTVMTSDESSLGGGRYLEVVVHA
jgi:hypothetical protein